MLTIDDLLKDSPYKEYFCKVPKLPAHITPETKPWRLYVQLKGEHRWRQRDFETYQEAFKKLKSMRPRVHDAAINCRALGFPPPNRIVRVKGKYFTNDAGVKMQVTKLVTWKPRIPADEFAEHFWCPYCRRPTEFKAFFRHHALPMKKTGGMPIDPAVRRCTICGVSERLVTLR